MNAGLNGAAEALWLALAPRLPGFTAEIVDEVDSTNTELMRRARAGQTEPVLLCARRQTAGRGRLGRQWAAGDAESSLTFSLGLPLAPADWSGLSLAVGVSLAESLHPALRLKWPNDLWVDGRKLAGILIETASTGGASANAEGARFVVIGVGVNLDAPGAQGLSTPPAGLRELLPGVGAGELLQRTVPPLAEAVLAFQAGGFDPFRARFSARDLLFGREVQLSDGSAGRAGGVDADGALLVHTAAGVQRVSSAEVSVRPVPQGTT